MRLWSLHPQYLDARGLVALWREALLAQAVLRGQTRGYTRHPQLARFLATTNPSATIASYLYPVHTVSEKRGYKFDATKLTHNSTVELIPVTQGQIDYEWQYLQGKLRHRAPAWLASIETVSSPIPHPSFRIVPGDIEPWEAIKSETK